MAAVPGLTHRTRSGRSVAESWTVDVDPRDLSRLALEVIAEPDGG